MSPPRAINGQRLVSDRNDIEREYNDTQLSKRKAYRPIPQPMEGRNEAAAKRRKPSLHKQHVTQGIDSNQSLTYPNAGEYLPMETRSRHKAHLSQETIDLTSSPRRPPFGHAGNLSGAPQGFPAARGVSHTYAPQVPRLSPVRNTYSEQAASAQPNPYMSVQDRMYQRHAPPSHEYASLRR